MLMIKRCSHVSQDMGDVMKEEQDNDKVMKIAMQTMEEINKRVKIR